MFNSLEVAAELGSQKVVLHPGHIGGLGVYIKETALAYANESLASIIDRAQDLGLCVCLENMFPRCRAFTEPEDFTEILQRFPRLKITLDTGHANIGSQRGQRIFRFIEQFGQRIGHLHVSDNFGERDDHIPVGAGKIDFVKTVKALKNSDTMIPPPWKYFQKTVGICRQAGIGLMKCLPKLENLMFSFDGLMTICFNIRKQKGLRPLAS
jgi:sugar phosphate isomerase/epimerase